MTRTQRIASNLIAIVDASLILWGAMAALMPQYLLGPKGAPILPAGYEGFTAASWQQLVTASPKAAGYITLLFRTYGAYCAALGVVMVAVALTVFRRGERWAWYALLIGNTIAFIAAMRYDWLVRAIGPFELMEYLGLALVWGALAATAPARATARQFNPAF
jgi:hypothetical protein